jgi:hypothetical protein
VGDAIPAGELKKIVAETINFDFPLVRLTRVVGSSKSPHSDPATDPPIFSLELFHGPTLAFKDVGARFMSRCLAHFVRGGDQPVTVLVATSGDTGGAVASGFHGVEGVNVVILYPSGKVSSVQELQLTTLGKNISALEIDGSFDDCQQMVKQAFADQALNKKMFLTSANSINVARWLPQQFYYFFAYKQWADKSRPPVISVPSGNFCPLAISSLHAMQMTPYPPICVPANTGSGRPLPPSPMQWMWVTPATSSASSNYFTRNSSPSARYSPATASPMTRRVWRSWISIGIIIISPIPMARSDGWPFPGTWRSIKTPRPPQPKKVFFSKRPIP